MRYPRVFIKTVKFFLLLVIILASLIGAPALSPARAQADNPNPPAEVVKLIFIHHSCGTNWLSDGNGELGRLLGENNYFVSDTNYGWGPDSIGDRTDVPDWLEWFRGPESGRYLDALYNESGQNSSFTRPLPDPGGENQVIMFKSCFPNSNISGNPDDPPQPGYDFTVANFKYIYNDLLNYFQTRPDKLFVVITQPPLIDRTHAENARAFSNWLVNEWLTENNYSLGNVAVFDFHNILTHPDNHHRYNNGGIEHVIQNGDGTLYYDSNGDAHPNTEGNRKASAEFIPLLNVYYHRWQSGASQEPPASPTEAPAPEATQPPAEQEPPLIAPPQGDGLIDDFEAGMPPGSYGWTGYWEEGVATTIQCGPEAGLSYSGGSALHFTYDVAQQSWATCNLEFETPRDWSAWQGLSFYLHANQAGLFVDLDVYDSAPEGWATYLHTVETTQQMADGWAYLELPWEMLLGADWEANAGAPLEPSRVAGIAIGIDGYREDALRGEVWLDDIRLVAASAPTTVPTSPPTEPPQATEPIGEPGPLPEEEDGGSALPGFCPGSAALGALVLGGLVWSKRRLHPK